MSHGGGFRLALAFSRAAATLTPRLAHNHRAGTLPTQIGNMESLLGFGAYSNAISGERRFHETCAPVWHHSSAGFCSFPRFSPAIAMLTSKLAHNHRAGTLPTEMGNMVSLEWFYVYNNDIGGEWRFHETCPSVGVSHGGGFRLTLALSCCAAAALTPRLAHNHRIGTLPTQIGLMVSLVWFYAQDNNIGGEERAELPGYAHPSAELIAWGVHRPLFSRPAAPLTPKLAHNHRGATSTIHHRVTTGGYAALCKHILKAPPPAQHIAQCTCQSVKYSNTH